jgi:hypothetical protein
MSVVLEYRVQMPMREEKRRRGAFVAYAAGCWGAATEAVSDAESLTSSARIVDPRPFPHSLTKSVNI